MGFSLQCSESLYKYVQEVHVIWVHPILKQRITPCNRGELPFDTLWNGKKKDAKSKAVCTGSRVLRCQLCQHQMTPVPSSEPPLGSATNGLQFCAAARPSSPPGRSAVCPTYGAPGSPPRSSYPPGYGTSPSYYQQAQGAPNIYPSNSSLFLDDSEKYR